MKIEAEEQDKRQRDIKSKQWDADLKEGVKVLMVFGGIILLISIFISVVDS
jgi:hypothetical protein